jgi:hypothetical protein
MILFMSSPFLKPKGDDLDHECQTLGPILSSMNSVHSPNTIQLNIRPIDVGLRFFLISWGGVRLNLLGTSATIWLFVPASGNR